jgi:hypothetical protein
LRLNAIERKRAQTRLINENVDSPNGIVIADVVIALCRKSWGSGFDPAAQRVLDLGEMGRRTLLRRARGAGGASGGYCRQGGEGRGGVRRRLFRHAASSTCLAMSGRAFRGRWRANLVLGKLPRKLPDLSGIQATFLETGVPRAVMRVENLADDAGFLAYPVVTHTH